MEYQDFSKSDLNCLSILQPFFCLCIQVLQ
uniref:Uncharacterized protein n=1 Tax=Myoviridae sp. ctBtT5 TaxID=2825048 RepID=A0A8S5PZI0_9CAUD|nr:MAG TPA: hypothetical protein [Myoviridae sp. ctBtT5]